MSIITKELDTSAASCGWFAARDAERYNNECMSEYSSKERSLAQQVRDLLDLVFSGKFYINYRKTFIAVKVDGAIVKDRKLAREVDDILSGKGVIKVITKQGVVYRIATK